MSSSFNRCTSILFSNGRQCPVYGRLTNLLQPNLKNLSAPRYLSKVKSIKCWKCGIEKRSILDLFCQQCNVIQNPQEEGNYFKVLGIDERFDIDNKALTKRYRNMQSVLHPDKFSNSTEEEKLISENYSSLVNKAYQVLQSPLKRAIHLLAIRGEKIQEDQKLENPEFLMEIMELNEEVEGADTPEKLKQLDTKNKRQLSEIEQNITECFRNGNLKDAKIQIIKMKYYWSIAAHINRLLRERGIVD